MIFLEVNGDEYEGFTEISVLRSIGSLSGFSSFGITSDSKVSLPIKTGQSCRVLIDKTPVLSGYIENMNGDYDAESHNLWLSCRDKTMDVIDCSTSIKELSGTLSLEAVIRRILDGNGLPDISVINNVSGLAPFKDGDIESAEVGETRFEFMNRYSQKRQVLLTGDGNGNIVITRSGTIEAVTALLNVVGGDNNNVLSGAYSYSDTDLFRQYIVNSQQNPVASESSGDIPISEIVNQSGTAIDGDVRENRLIEIRPDQSGSKVDSGLFATWSKNISRAKSFGYTAVVQGHYQDEAKTRLWVPNEIVSVKDDFAGMETQLDAQLLIDTVEYRLDLETGSTTVITCVDKNAYTMQQEPDVREERANDLGDKPSIGASVGVVPSSVGGARRFF